jgi:hypothetical protein
VPYIFHPALLHCSPYPAPPTLHHLPCTTYPAPPALHRLPCTAHPLTRHRLPRPGSPPRRQTPQGPYLFFPSFLPPTYPQPTLYTLPYFGRQPPYLYTLRPRSGGPHARKGSGAASDFPKNYFVWGFEKTPSFANKPSLGSHVKSDLVVFPCTTYPAPPTLHPPPALRARHSPNTSATRPAPLPCTTYPAPPTLHPSPALPRAFAARFLTKFRNFHTPTLYLPCTRPPPSRVRSPPVF